MARGERTEHHPDRRVDRAGCAAKSLEASGSYDFLKQKSKREQKDSWSDEEYKQRTGRRILPSTNATTGEVDTGRS